MKFFELLENAEDIDIDICDKEYDVLTTFCWSKDALSSKDPLDIFYVTFAKKVEIDKIISTNHISLDIVGFIRNNKSLFEDFMKKSWKNQYEDEEDFEYEWCREFFLFLEGNACNSQYASLTEVFNNCK